MKTTNHHLAISSAVMLIAGIIFSGFILIGTTDENQHRFIEIVRRDMFNGFSGDTIALARAMKLCDDSLNVNPAHADALAFHGSAIWFLSGKAFQNGNFQKGMKLSDSGMNQMDRSVALAPNKPSVLIIRGATLLATAPFVPEPQKKQFLEKGMGDFLHTLEIQKEYFSTLPAHPRGELLAGIADSYRQLGNFKLAKKFYTRITKEVPGSQYAERATQWLKAKEKGGKFEPATCIGCHN